MNKRELAILQTEFKHHQPRTKESVVSEIANWLGGNPAETFDYAAKKGYIKKTGKDMFRDDLWEWVGTPRSAKSLNARAQSVLIYAKALQSAEKEKWITVKNNPVKLEEGKTVGESIKSHFKKVNEKKSKEKSEKYSDSKSMGKYNAVQVVMKTGIEDLADHDITSTIFGEDFELFADPFSVLTKGHEEDSEKLRKAYKRVAEISDNYEYGTNFEETDKEFDKAVKEFDVKGAMKNRRIVSDAYNDHMEEEMQKKDAPIYRFVDVGEIKDILETKKFRDSYQDVRERKITSVEPPAPKCWTINKKHALRMSGIRIQAKRGDYDFKILKSTAYPRYTKSIKHGQNIKPTGLAQKELRLKVGEGLDITNGLTIQHLPKVFYDYMEKTQGYTKEDVQKLIKESGFTIEENKDA